MPKLLVTGVSGYLGTAVREAAHAAGWAVTGTWLEHRPAGAGAVRLDLRDAEAVRRVVAHARPDAVVHAAYRQEGEDIEAINVTGAAQVAAAARAGGARLVHLSSDVVFRGDLGRPLREEDPPDPVTAYGATKARAEAAVAAAHPGALLVRTSLIYGGPGRPVSRHEALALAAARGEREVAFFTDEIRCPVQVGDLAAALLELAALDVAGPLHAGGADAVSRYEFAALVVAAHGLDPAALAGAPSPPDRPHDCTLDSARARALLATRLRGAREVLGR